MESRIKLREKLLSKEKREQITKLSVLKQHVDQAKDRMIVVNTSGQLKREAIESEHDYLVANLELVKAKKRLIDIETEMRELRLFGEKYTGEQQESPEAENPEEIAKPADEVKFTKEAKTTEVTSITEVARRPLKPPLKKRLSKEVMMYSEAVSPEVDREGFNSPGDPPPPRKVMDNVKVRTLPPLKCNDPPLNSIKIISLPGLFHLFTWKSFTQASFKLYLCVNHQLLN